MKEIKLTQGKYALVDDEDFRKLNQVNWCYLKKDRISREYGLPFRQKNKKIIYMHNELMGKIDGYEIDHIDGDGLNNQKNNLRRVTHQQNCCNLRSNRGLSKYKGVHRYSKGKKWRSQITCNYETFYLGFFENEEDAARAYNVAALKYFGNFAHLNEL